MPEALNENVQTMGKYFNYGADVPKYFEMIQKLNDTSKPEDFKRVIDQWVTVVPKNHVPNWMVREIYESNMYIYIFF